MLWLVQHAISALFPGNERLPQAGGPELTRFLAQFRREAPATMWLGLLLSALAFALLPPVTIGRARLSFWLDSDDLDRHAEGMCSFQIYLLRQLAFILKFVGGLYWGQLPSVRQEMNMEALPADPGTWRS